MNVKNLAGSYWKNRQFYFVRFATTTQQNNPLLFKKAKKENIENTFSSKREQKSISYLNSLKDELREVQANKTKQQKKEEENQPIFSFRSEVDNSLILPTKKKPIEKETRLKRKSSFVKSILSDGEVDPAKAKERLNAEFEKLIREAKYTESSAEEFFTLIASGPVGQRTKGLR